MEWAEGERESWAYWAGTRAGRGAWIGGPSGVKRPAGLAVGGWAGFCFSYFSFPFSFLFQTALKLFEFKHKFEFEPDALNQKQLMHQHECTNMFKLRRILILCEIKLD